MLMLASCLAIALSGQSSSGGVEVPFHVNGNAIIVDAKVNGTPCSLMFDTGFGGTVLLSSSIDVGAPSGHMILRDFVGEIPADTVTLKSFQLGAQMLKPDEQMIVKQPGDFTAAYGQHVDGIMGLGAVKDKVTEINYEKQKFIFYPASTDITKRTPDEKKTFLVKMLPIGGNSIELQVSTPKGQQMVLALDTGNAFYATTHRDVLERIGLWDPNKKPKFTRLSGVASGAVESWSMKMPPLSIFGVQTQPTVWDVIDLPSSSAEGDGTVGFGFLSNFNVTFDYARRRVWLENWKTPIENKEPGDVGISARFDRGLKRTVVVLVAPGSPADQAGVKVEDEVLSIDSTDLIHPTSNELRAMFEGEVGSKIRIAISRNGSLKRFELTRAALYNE